MTTMPRHLRSLRALARGTVWLAMVLGWGCAKSGDSRSFASPPPSQEVESATDALDAALDPARELEALARELQGYEARLASLQRRSAQEPGAAAMSPAAEASPPRSAPVGGATSSDFTAAESVPSTRGPERKRKRASKSSGRTRNARGEGRGKKDRYDIADSVDPFDDVSRPSRAAEDTPQMADPPADDEPAATVDAAEGAAVSEDVSPARCEEICQVAAAVCDLETRICDLAASHPGEAAYEDLCVRARGDCVAAADACEACGESEPVEE